MKRRDFLLAAACVCAPLARAATPDGAGATEVEAMARDGLRRSVEAALARLGRENGFFADARVKIGLSNNLRTADRILRSLGEGGKVDGLILAMNRAAELALPKTQKLLLDAVQALRISDAKTLVSDGDQALTGYFRKATEVELGVALAPAIHGVAEQSGLTRAYDALSHTLVRLAGIKSRQATVEDYVNRKARDGLYAIMGAEERAMRADPSRFAGSAGKLFSSLK
ncbi:MAG: DUF4197 domain-containing protein [Pseudomonadota bacterium]